MPSHCRVVTEEHDQGYDSIAHISHDGQVSNSYPLLLETACNLEVYYFPFDTQVSEASSSVSSSTRWFGVCDTDMPMIQMPKLINTVGCVSVWACVHVYAHMRANTCINTRTRIYTHTRTHEHTSTYTSIHAHTCCCCRRRMLFVISGFEAHSYTNVLLTHALLLNISLTTPISHLRVLALTTTLTISTSHRPVDRNAIWRSSHGRTIGRSSTWCRSALTSQSLTTTRPGNWRASQWWRQVTTTRVSETSPSPPLPSSSSWLVYRT